ncbi:TraC family protein, partial [Ruegeria sp. HKCCD8929]|uniref:TraC family protein n=1 Tax=Ruegeria sp. HKCCD8929 TaxID=2683006 RepID=UPI001489BD55
MNFMKEAMSGLFGDTPWTEETPELMDGEVFSDILPYRVYDPETRLYHFEHGTGFLMEVGPAVGRADLAENVGGVINQNLPSDATFQVLNWTSPNVEQLSGAWKQARQGRSDLIDEMIEQRVHHFNDIRFGSDVSGARAIPFDRHVFLAAWIDNTDITLDQEKKLQT